MGPGPGFRDQINFSTRSLKVGPGPGFRDPIVIVLQRNHLWRKLTMVRWNLKLEEIDDFALLQSNHLWRKLTISSEGSQNLHLKAYIKTLFLLVSVH